jgi:hypothetical protein
MDYLHNSCIIEGKGYDRGRSGQELSPAVFVISREMVKK